MEECFPCLRTKLISNASDWIYTLRCSCRAATAASLHKVVFCQCARWTLICFVGREAETPQCGGQTTVMGSTNDGISCLAAKGIFVGVVSATKILWRICSCMDSYSLARSCPCLSLAFLHGIRQVDLRCTR
mmetsp:Transcript_25610/g.73618  ORF Transcript_25610/g.73618 Transcript_25610/m.73618 type:complete len:131 (+) Transcript_25610:644-1036(+)